MKKILLTGGNGFWGTRFTAKYQTKYDILSTDVPDLDITNASKVNEVIKTFKPDLVIHTAAVASTDFCNKNPELARKINVDGALNVASACQSIKSKMIFISSEQVFNGNTDSGPYSETDLPVPDTMYGKTKLEAEHLLKSVLDELWILRFTWLFGVPERNCGMASNILWDTISSVLKGKKIGVPCHEYRGLTYIYEMLDQFEKVFSLPYDTYHIGSHNNLSRYDIVCHILNELGLGDRIEDLIEIDTEKYKDQNRDIRLNTDKIKQFGLIFSDSTEALSKCITEFKLKV